MDNSNPLVSDGPASVGCISVHDTGSWWNWEKKIVLLQFFSPVNYECATHRSGRNAADEKLCERPFVRMENIKIDAVNPFCCKSEQLLI